MPKGVINQLSSSSMTRVMVVLIRGFRRKDDLSYICLKIKGKCSSVNHLIQRKRIPSEHMPSRGDGACDQMRTCALQGARVWCNAGIARNVVNGSEHHGHQILP